MINLHSLSKKGFIDRHILALIFICGVIFISHSLYVSKTYQYPKWDEHIFLGQAIKAYDEIHTPSQSTISNLAKIFESKPPIYGMAITLALLTTGTENTYKVALFINVIFYITSIIGIYYLAGKFFSKTPALIASLLFATYGFPLFYLHFVYSETATTTFVVMTMLFIAYSDNFSNRKSSFFGGLFFLFGNITRWVTPIFILGALLTSLTKGGYQNIRKKKDYKAFINIAIFFSLGIGFSMAIYYIPNFFYFSSYASNTAKQAPEWVESLNYLPSGLSNPFSVHSVMFYFNILSQQTVFLFLLFGIGFIICLVKIKKYAFLILSFTFPYLFFTFASVLKDDRYIVPIYPIMAIISAAVFEHIKHKLLRNFLITLVVIITSLNFLGASWAVGPLGFQGLKDIVLPELIRHPRRIYLTTMVWPPMKDTTRAQSIVVVVDKSRRGIKNPLILNTYTVNPLELDVALTSLEQFKKRGQFRATGLRVIDPGDYNELFSRINQADFIIVKGKNETIDQSKYTDHATDRMIIVFNKALELNNGIPPQPFQKIGDVYYPLDKIWLDIYVKRQSFTSQEWHNFGAFLKKADPEYVKSINNALLEVTEKSQ